MQKGGLSARKEGHVIYSSLLINYTFSFIANLHITTAHCTEDMKIIYSASGCGSFMVKLLAFLGSKLAHKP